ncbi:membrane protein [Actinorhabdospora filicis]|uniref:Membrane protein n=1 Tax=Actinorhabdospora filicis TaxID=1785913 RepID=A0A9W6STH1_9ACTN|nr:anthrone oxygenase family protein [Actinorhabdospora filicis]GLZ81763.1 membrane protein [Actinorhabdospora filicis]
MNAADIVTIAAGVTGALISGVFFGFSVAVNPGLHALSDADYLKAMHSINRKILNPVFLLTFVGSAILVVVAAIMAAGTDGFWLLVAAAALYVVGLFFVTAGGNVPLNNRLDAFDPYTADEAALAEMRGVFEKPWNRLHTVRTLAGIAATILVFCALAV